MGELVEDSDVDSVKEEISKARKILIDIESVKCGLLDRTLLEQLREVRRSIVCRLLFNIMNDNYFCSYLLALTGRKMIIFHGKLHQQKAF